MNNKEFVFQIVKEIINALQPSRLLTDFFSKENFINFIKSLNKIYVISMGKAGYTMAKTFLSFAEKFRIPVLGGFVVTPYGTKEEDLHNIEIIESSHPFPDENSLYAGMRFLEVANSLPYDVSILFLLSGGASALIEKPVDGITLPFLQNLTKRLLLSGATIQEINTVRKKFSYLKNGGAGEILFPRKIYQILLSDVIGEDSHKHVSSGLLYHEPISLQDVIRILKKYNITLEVEMEKLSFPEKKQSSLQQTWIVGNNRIACEIAANILKSYNFTTKIVKSEFQDTIENYEKLILFSLREEIKSINEKTALVWGGEPSVTVTGNGKGGRNQELVLRITRYMDEFKDYVSRIIFVSFGTDGIDGPTDAAGAMMDFETREILETMLRETKSNSTIDDFIANNDSYTALSLAGSLIKTGPTGTNLNDISIAFLFPE